MIDTKIFSYSDLEIIYFESRDASLAVRKIGSGPPLIFVHGWPLHSYSWRNILPQLSKHFTCYLIDMPGLGDSRWTVKTNFHWSQQASRLIDLINHFNLTQFSFIAHDSGASITRTAVLAMDSNLKKQLNNLIIINTEIPNHRPPFIPLYQRISLLPFATTIFKFLLGKRSFVRSKFGFGGFYHNKNLLDNREYFIKPYIESLTENTRRLKGAQKYLVGCDLKLSDTFKNRHKEITANVLIIWGIHCQIFPVAEAIKMKDQFTNAYFEKIQDSAFLPHEEKPKEVVRSILDFLMKK